MKLDVAEEREIENMELIGGDLCLDFTNSVGVHGPPADEELLTSYAALVAWSRRAGILSAQTARHLLQKAEREPEQAQMVLAQAIALREALYHIFSALSQGNKLKAADLEVVNQNLADALPHGRIRAGDSGFQWGWEPAEDALDQMLWPIVRSAEQLLTSGQLARVHECDGENCNWLFLDVSKNHSRRWCSMNECGNRAKVSRFYQRKKATV